LAIKNNIKISIIISVYKNVQALNIILKSLKNQTVKVDEVIISEDGNSEVMKNFITTLEDNNIVHLTCEDIGWRKNVALNKAIQIANGEYLIFIDGDVVPHKRFVEGHISQAKLKRVCAGKRVELGESISKKILNEEYPIEKVTDNYIWWIKKLHDDKVRHYEDGIYIKPNGWIYKNIVAKKTISYLIGCNFSCFKEDILSINGFDEDYINPAIGEDVDINWRFRASGIEVISVRNIANVYHMWHKKGFGSDEGKINNKILSNTIKNNQYICLNGIEKLTKGEA